jgi:hypothetical protein
LAAPVVEVKIESVNIAWLEIDPVDKSTDWEVAQM